MADAKTTYREARADALQAVAIRRTGGDAEMRAKKMNVLAYGVDVLASRMDALAAKVDSSAPYATNIKADWKAVQSGKAWYAQGTSVGELMTVKQASRDAAERYAARMNANAREAIEGNARWEADRRANAKEILEKRAARIPKQGSLF